MENTNPNQNPEQKPQQPQQPAAPAAIPAAPDGLTAEQKAVFDQLADTVRQAQMAAKAASAKAEEPWYWSEFSKGVYVGAGVVLLAVGGVYLYKKYTSDAEA